MWIDTHCHLDAPEFGAQAAAERARARAAGVAWCVLPAVRAADFARVRVLAHELGDVYALGIHPLCVPEADEADLAALEDCLTRWAADPRLVAVGEIGLDFFVPELATEPLRGKQLAFLRAQLALAQRHGLPVILHVRRSVDAVTAALRQAGRGLVGGIAHAFNGSAQQAQALLALGLRLGFGGAATFEAAQRLRRLVAQLPLQALVLETDAPDIPPQWLYVPAAERAAGRPAPRNTPAELPRIGAALAALRGLEPLELARATAANAAQALPRLGALIAAEAAR
ncbi:putative metal-dependent hydrolase YjjV [Tepidimonas alkaliphilus]|uniref:Putative metal-dependent hydrolase YjjV n=1 Tax=Tepidimonas alkaliphilus TaxID=2588942 RepID=A0A554W5M6_9BURK|nr:TatD family hydrolase [Tepidimonas alkaliphilus]TSE18869.1 putative metal-dependent hydrolase YjjV [Tepidimonas alkaliphilus]